MGNENRWFADFEYDDNYNLNVDALDLKADQIDHFGSQRMSDSDFGSGDPPLASRLLRRSAELRDE